MTISQNVFGVPDPPEDMHGPPHSHPWLPAYSPQTDPVTVMHRVASIADPAKRAAELTARLAIAQQWVEWGSEQRDRAIVQMRARGASYDDVARSLNVSKSRAQQLCRRLVARYPDGVAEWQREPHGHDAEQLPAPRRS